MANKLLTHNLSEPLNGTKTATVDINTDSGNLTIDRLSGGEQVLANGTLQYFENEDIPTQTLDSSHGKTTLTLKSGRSRQSWFHFPWSACNGAYEWQIHLNPTVKSDITAHTGGGNLKINLADMAVTHLTADSGGGNLDVILPDKVADLNVSAHTGGGNVTVEMGTANTGCSIVEANSGAGNVVVYVPSGLAAKIHAASGWGKVIVDSRFSMIGDNTYQSLDYESAANKVEITAKSGAGNVSVKPK